MPNVIKFSHLSLQNLKCYPDVLSFLLDKMSEFPDR